MTTDLLPIGPHDHPEPRTMTWTQVELAAIRDYAARCVAAERERDAAASKQAWVDVLAERCRQIEVEGWTPEHDDCHRDGSLAKAAYCYAWAACGLGMESPPPAPPGWPWAGTWWKPRDTRSNLVRAAALLLAEIDRLDRQAGEKT